MDDKTLFRQFANRISYQVRYLTDFFSWIHVTKHFTVGTMYTNAEIGRHFYKHITLWRLSL